MDIFTNFYNPAQIDPGWGYLGHPDLRYFGRGSRIIVRGTIFFKSVILSTNVQMVSIVQLFHHLFENLSVR